MAFIGGGPDSGAVGGMRSPVGARVLGERLLQAGSLQDGTANNVQPNPFPRPATQLETGSGTFVRCFVGT